ncbi:hypothetical protein EW146_g8411 [Bondarzewia mesenterica]|uniref:Methionine aminopeptidase n=1 Tax=Bondarzewia mesenterica TaxID=1095465 RepID=A0A4S4LGC8_9AGAM|nr:hypothetical protein EW146_g8411 [Bondarzewia mesenterica]
MFIRLDSFFLFLRSSSQAFTLALPTSKRECTELSYRLNNLTLMLLLRVHFRKSSRNIVSSHSHTRSIQRTFSSSGAISEKPCYITTPIFYPNAGHLWSIVTADIFARHARLIKPERPVFFLTGTDEHGFKIQKAAKEKGSDPSSFCDELSQHFRALAERANISHTRFIRTTEKDHHDAVQHVWRLLDSKGLIYKDTHQGWYSVSDECFYTDSQITKSGKGDVNISVETGSAVEWMHEENYKFRLSAFRDSLIARYQMQTDSVYPPSQYANVLAMLSQPVEDLSISRPRSRLHWGVPVPGDPEHTMYVWFDALTNYLTGTGYPWTNSNEDGSLTGWPPDLQVIGKDIVRFHAVYLPAMLQALGLPLPKRILAHSHWTVDKKKMSKSIGNVADPFKAMDELGTDVVRYYLARVGGRFKDDVDWSTQQLNKHASELQSLLGNLHRRITSDAIKKRLHGVFTLGSAIHDSTIVASVVPLLEALSSEVDEQLQLLQVAEALDLIMHQLQVMNKVLSITEPWSKKTEISIVKEVYAISIETLRICGILLQPFTPTKAQELLDALKVPHSERTWSHARFLVIVPERQAYDRETCISFRRRYPQKNFANVLASLYESCTALLRLYTLPTLFHLLYFPPIAVERTPSNQPKSDMLATPRSIDAILNDQLYIGNLSSAMTLDIHPELGITHLVSVCPDYPSQGPDHLTIPVQDSEHEDLLIHFPKACRFIQTVLDEGGKVLVHCVMGISRSATVISAYRRPQVQPNYGFIKQLHAFSACDHDPTRTNPAYRAWKRRQRQDVNCFLNSISDTIAIIPDKLYLSRSVNFAFPQSCLPSNDHLRSARSEFPNDPEQAACLISYLGFTHFLSIPPAQQPPPSLNINYCNLNIPSFRREGLLLALPETCRYIQTAVEKGGQVIVHCQTESNAAVVVCAYLMWSRRIPCSQAYKILQDGKHRFTSHVLSVYTHLEVFAACNCSPKLDHPAVQAWLAESRNVVNFTSAVASATAAMNRITINSDPDLDKASLRAVGTRTRARIGIGVLALEQLPFKLPICLHANRLAAFPCFHLPLKVWILKLTPSEITQSYFRLSHLSLVYLTSTPRLVPPHIPLPPYVSSLSPSDRKPGEDQRPFHGDPYSGDGRIPLGGEDEARLRRAARLAKTVLDYAGSLAKVGMTTDSIDSAVHDFIISHSAYPSPLLYSGFPKSCCTSINNVLVHGIPDERPLEDGDIINIDITVYMDGCHGDTSKTFLVGDVDKQGRDLLSAVDDALDSGIAVCGPGRPFNVIGEAIQKFATERGYSVSREFTGHGIGQVFHRSPWIFHTRNDEPGVMLPGHCFTIEVRSLFNSACVFDPYYAIALPDTRVQSARLDIP